MRAPKTGAGTRMIELEEELLDVLRQHRRRQIAERLLAGPAWVDHGLVFCSQSGTPLLSGGLLRTFRVLLARAGLPTSYCVHDLRHTAVSSLLVAGVPLAEVAQLAGHASPAITSALYAHAIRRSRSPATAQLAAFYRRSGDGDVLAPDGDGGPAERAEGAGAGGS
jgi:integrase